MCFKNLCPKPFPSEAPSISPGISEIIYPKNSPRFGSRVVNGCAPIFALAFVIAFSRLDFPAFGSPISPISATSSTSIKKSASSPGHPFVISFGLLFVELLKCSFPRPLAPPLSNKIFSLSFKRETFSPVFKFVITEPIGTKISKSFPTAPCKLFFIPSCPLSAINSFFVR